MTLTTFGKKGSLGQHMEIEETAEIPRIVNLRVALGLSLFLWILIGLAVTLLYR